MTEYDAMFQEYTNELFNISENFVAKMESMYQTFMQTFDLGEATFQRNTSTKFKFLTLKSNQIIVVQQDLEVIKYNECLVEDRKNVHESVMNNQHTKLKNDIAEIKTITEASEWIQQQLTKMQKQTQQMNKQIKHVDQNQHYCVNWITVSRHEKGISIEISGKRYVLVYTKDSKWRLQGNDDNARLIVAEYNLHNRIELLFSSLRMLGQISS